MGFTHEITLLKDLVKSSSLFATVSFNSLIDKLPELESRANKINTEDYDFLFMVGWVYSGILWIGRTHDDGLPQDVVDIVFDPSILKQGGTQDPLLTAVHDQIDNRHNRWVFAGRDALNDLTKFVDMGINLKGDYNDKLLCFIIGQWFLWNLFSERPEWASTQTCAVVGSMLYKGAISTLGA